MGSIDLDDIMKFTRQFKVKASLEEVKNFHSNPSSMAAITPPPLIVQMNSAPAELKEGDNMEFTIWFGPLPIRWRAIIEEVDAQGFVDRQLNGPFGSWKHIHNFEPVDSNTTIVKDEVIASIKNHALWGLVGLGMWLGMPLLFGYRAWKTRRMLSN